MGSMAEYAISMGLDLTIAPDGREWEDSKLNRPKINREIWGYISPLNLEFKQIEEGHEEDDDYEREYDHSEYMNENELFLHNFKAAYFEDEEIEKYSYDAEVMKLANSFTNNRDEEVVNSLALKLANTDSYFFRDSLDAIEFSKQFTPSSMRESANKIGFLVETKCVVPENHYRTSYNLRTRILLLDNTIEEEFLDVINFLQHGYNIQNICEKTSLNEDSVTIFIDKLKQEYGQKFDINYR